MTDLWHDLRAQHVGGSEVAALFGESPYLTHFALWQIKAGIMPAPDLDDNERVSAGKFLEDGIIAWANKKWDTYFEPAGVYVKHATVPGMGCTPDAFENTTMCARTIAQVKLVDGLEFRNKWEAEGHLITKAPVHILLQVQHELECCALELAVLIVCVGGNRLYRMNIKADDEVANLLRCKVKQFWLDIAANKPPPPDFARDTYSIKFLNNRLPVVPEITLDKSAVPLLRQRLKVSKKAKLAADKLEEINAEIEYNMGPALIARCGDFMLRRTKTGSIRLQSFEEVF